MTRILEIVQRDAARAVFNPFAFISMIMTTVSVFSWWTSMASLPLADAVQAVVEAYRRVFHPMVVFLFGWTGLQFQPWMKDVVVIWLAIGGAVTATTSTLLFHLRTADPDYYATSEPALDRFEKLIRGKYYWPFWVVASILLWPAFLAYYVWKPMVVRSQFGKSYFLLTIDEYQTRDQVYSRFKKLRANLRLVLLLRVSFTALSIWTMVLTNAAVITGASGR